MQSKAVTVAEYLGSLPPDRREAVEAVRAVILKNLGKDFAEGMSYGMMGYYIPHSVFPAGYHCDPKQPLPYAGIASQKQGISVYLMGLYIGGGEAGEETDDSRWFKDAWAKTGKKLDMGKACIRFKQIEDVPLEVIGEAIRRVPSKVYIERYVASLASRGGAGKGGAAGAAKKTAKKITKKAASKKVGKSAAKKSVTKKTPARTAKAGRGRAAAGKRASK
jgi:uncharacterized protein YdhG (YjbR/CyaY superfamily)